MLNICPSCGSYRADKTVVSNPESVICPDCGASFPFVRQPLFILSGASGTGKSTVTLLLTGPDLPAIVLDSDILWDTEYALPEMWPVWFNRWLRLCKNIGQSGKPVLLCGAGFGVPDNLDSCVELRYFSEYHILALVCKETLLAERLRSRPSWRASDETESLQSQMDHNRWYMQYADGSNSHIAVLDTTDVEPATTAEQVRRWLQSKMNVPVLNS